MRRLVLLLIFCASAAFAVEPDEVLDDPELEARARTISAEVRCVVCQNEPIDSSNAGVARDLRLLIRERLVAGDTDQQVLDYLVARYGDYVLFRPPFKPQTYALWIGPFAILAFGAIAVLVSLSRKRGQGAETGQPLSPQSQARLDELLKEDDPAP